MDKSTRPLTKPRKDNYEKDLEDSIKHENDKTTNQLLHTVSEIKKTALRIGGITTKSNSNLDKSMQKYDDSNKKMNDTIQKLTEVLSNKSSVVFYAIIFMLVILFFLYKVTY